MNREDLESMQELGLLSTCFMVAIPVYVAIISPIVAVWYDGSGTTRPYVIGILFAQFILAAALIVMRGIKFTSDYTAGTLAIDFVSNTVSYLTPVILIVLFALTGTSTWPIVLLLVIQVVLTLGAIIPISLSTWATYSLKKI